MRRKVSKKDTILKLLARPKGASIAELEKATKWQAHSLRAALTALRKKGHHVERSRDQRITRYRLARQRAAA
jgi:predicted transcriptional regulator